ncbi:MAG: hypothetical protein NZZ41_02840 [Candidatus Dojkabacteria bacterium]|nr:hypothetical protein [Candidatus Dojkabacteria bacterium]
MFFFADPKTYNKLVDALKIVKKNKSNADVAKEFIDGFFGENNIEKHVDQVLTLIGAQNQRDWLMMK